MTTTLIEDHRDEIVALCRAYGVRRLEVFGSAARDDFDPERSDVDLLYEWDESVGRNRFHDYFDLKEALEVLLGRSVDLVSSQAMRNPYLIAAIKPERRLVYAA